MLSARKFSIISLTVLSVLILISVSEYWYYTPDGGIYIGTALNMLKHGEYVFNGYPNLQYYPGFSTILTIPLSIFGLNFYILNIFSALIVIALLWTLSFYFNISKYGSIIILLPLIFFSSTIFQQQITYLLSGASFLLLIIIIALLWRQYSESPSNKTLLLCLFLVSISPLFRFEGLFVILSFSLSYLFIEYRIKKKVIPTLINTSIMSFIVILPFTLWTFRNYILYTPDTFNMANNVFFGLKGLSLYAPDFHRVDWIEPGSWKYGIYNFYYSIRAISYSFIGYVVDLKSFYGELFRLFFLLIAGVFGIYGIKKWFKEANTFEFIFVILLTSFFIYRSLTSQHLHVVARYWLALLPFYISIILLGYIELISSLKNQYLKYTVISSAVVILVTIASNGATVFSSSKNNENKEKYYSDANEVLLSMSNYVDKTTSINTVLASTDWGVIPFYMQRKSFQILNDDSLEYRLSLQRILKYQAKYLVILNNNSGFATSAKKMTQTYPIIFQLESNFEPQNKIGPVGSIYKINLDELQNKLKRKIF